MSSHAAPIPSAIAELAKRTVRTRDGKIGELTRDALGRLERVTFPEDRQEYWISYADDQSRRINALSYFDLKTDKVRTILMIRPPNENGERRKIAGRLEILDIDDELSALRNLVFNPENFDLDWDYLSAALRTPREREQCMIQCKKTCADGARIWGTVCGIGAGLVVAPTVVGVVASAAACWAVSDVYEASCNSDCDWHCR